MAGDEYQQLITDLFEKIMIYDLKVAEASVEEVDGEFEVSMTVEAQQLEADGEGREQPVSLNAVVDVAIFPEAPDDMPENWLPEPLHIEKRTLAEGSQTFTFRVPERPAQVGVDPYVKMIDRNPDDNLRSL